jgi:hypothetical protein
VLLLAAVADRVDHADTVSIAEWCRGLFKTLAATNDLARPRDELQLNRPGRFSDLGQLHRLSDTPLDEA